MARRARTCFLLSLLLLVPLAITAAESSPGSETGDQELQTLARAVWYVSPMGSDVTGDCSLTNPYATIQHAIDLAAIGDEVRALAGEYYENVVMATGVDVIGAGAGLSTILGEPITQGVVRFQNVTDCSLTDFRVTVTHNVAGYDRAIVFGNGLDDSAALRNCLIDHVQ